MIAGIQTIIFDLGAVLYEIDYAHIEAEFLSLQERYAIAGTAPRVRYSRTYQPEIITQYEIGAITTEAFRSGVRATFHIEQATDDEIDSAWNAILVGLFPGRVEFLQALRSRFRLGLLSNTNALHIAAITKECHQLFECFDTVVLSHLVGTRKPNADIFHHTLSDLSAEPATTLFVDDSPQHIQSATALGIHTLWLAEPHNFEQAVSALVG
jgi:glucose-1-phosphatase